MLSATAGNLLSALRENATRQVHAYHVFGTSDAEGFAAMGDADPWPTLLWATGRAGLHGRPRLTTWRWEGAPRSGG